MIHEYALDPEALADWPTTRYLLDQFGAQHGRLISRYPNEWKRLVYEACDGCSPLDKKRIEERLAGSDNKLVRSGRIFDRALHWIDNAKRSHNESPFRLIISNARNASNGIVDAAEIGPDTTGWLPDSGHVARKAKQLCDAALPLLIGAKTICLVDPHFSCAARHCKPLQQIVKQVCLHSNAKVISYHLLAKEATAECFEKKIRGNELKWVRQALRDNQALGDKAVHFYRWTEREGGEAFHARYILTDRGGLLYENGLDEGPDGQTTNVLCMREVDWRLVTKCFDEYEPAYDLTDAWCLSANGVSKLPRVS